MRISFIYPFYVWEILNVQNYRRPHYPWRKMVKPQGRRLFAITYSGTSNETSTPGRSTMVLNQWPTSLATTAQPLTWRIKNSVGAYPQVSSPKYVCHLDCAPHCSLLPTATSLMGTRPQRAACMRARILMMYARGLKGREVHTQSWHYMHEWLEQYLRYNFLILFPIVYGFVFSSRRSGRRERKSNPWWFRFSA